MRKEILFGLMLSGVFLLAVFFSSVINAGEVTVQVGGSSLEKVYNINTQTVLIRDSSMDKDLLTAKLDSPINMQVGRGYQEVAEISTTKDFLEYFQKFNFYNIKKDEKTQRQVDFKYWGDVSQNVYKYNCKEILTENGTSIKTDDCEKTIVGAHLSKGWIDIDLNSLGSLPEGDLKIGLFTNVEKGDSIEWIPTFNVDGNLISVNEWATWTENLNSGLVGYYKLNEASGAVHDETGLNDGTNYGATTYANGILGKSYEFMESESDRVSIPKSSSLNITGNYSVCSWIRINNIQYGERGIVGDGTSDTDSGHLLMLTIYSPPRFSVKQESGSIVGVNSPSGINVDTWTHVCGVYVAGQSISLYVNGTEVASTDSDIESSSQYNEDAFTIGSLTNDRTVNASVDEVGIWNRTLNSTEISDLYNEGVGITPPGNGSNLDISLNSPINNQGILSDTYTFSVTPRSSNSTILNVSIYGNWNGLWHLIVSNESALNNNVTNFTIQEIPNGIYIWNAQVSDGDNSNFSGSNFTFTMVAAGKRFLNKTENDVATEYNLSTNNVSIMTFPVLENRNYTIRCDLTGISDSSTAGIRVNITTPADPEYFKASITNPTTSSSALFVACSGYNNWCNASGTAAPSVPIPITIEGRLVNGLNGGGFINLTIGSELSGVPITIMRESSCWIMDEN